MTRAAVTAEAAGGKGRKKGHVVPQGYRLPAASAPSPPNYLMSCGLSILPPHLPVPFCSDASKLACVKTVADLRTKMQDSGIECVVLRRGNYTLDKMLSIPDPKRMPPFPPTPGTNNYFAIVAAADEEVTLDADGKSRVFDVSYDPTTLPAGSGVLLAGLRITGGSAIDHGGGIYNYGGVALHAWRCVIAGNHAKFTGGGISNHLGSVYINETEAASNLVDGSTGSAGGESGGGALFNSAKATIVASVLRHNRAQQGAGIVNTGRGAVLELSATNVTNNTATETPCDEARCRGGGIVNSYLSQMHMRGGMIADNRAGVQTPSGAALLNLGSSEIVDVSIFGNQGVDIVYNTGNLTVANSTLTLAAGQHGPLLLNAPPLLKDGTGITLTNASLDGGDGVTLSNEVSANIVYVLPAPKGTYLKGRLFQCAKLMCCPVQQSEGHCGAPLEKCDVQQCDYTRYNGTWIVQLNQGDQKGRYPKQCSSGFYGNATGKQFQMSPLCAGACPPGDYCEAGSIHPTPCPAGTYASTPGASSRLDCANCTRGHWCGEETGKPNACPAGTYNGEDGLDSSSGCLTCTEGSWCPSASVQPRLCPEGHFGNETGLKGQRGCHLCPEGSWCSKGLRYPCATNTYGRDLPAEQRTTQAACAQCPRHATTEGNGSTSAEQCLCDLGYYMLNGTCARCPVGTHCGVGSSAETLRLQPGYWRRTGSTDVRLCPTKALCKGDLLPSTDRYMEPRPVLGDYCRQHQTGILSTHYPFCSRCVRADQYVDDSYGGCRPCSAARWLSLYVGLGLMVMALLVMLVWRMMPAAGASKRAARLFVRRFRLFKNQASLVAKGKLVVGTFQILTHLDTVYEITLPQSGSAVDWRDALRIAFNLDVLAIPTPRLTCFWLPQFFQQLLAIAAAPLVVILLAAAVFTCRRKKQLVLPFTLWLSFFVLSHVSSIAFQAFACDPFDEGSISFLRADYTVVCYEDGRITPEYRNIQQLATLAILLYPVGIPVGYATLLFMSRRGRIWRLRGALQLLSKDYTKGAYFWELAETSKKLLLTGFLALPILQPGTLEQLLLALVISNAFLLVTFYASPFKERTDNAFAVICDFSLVLIFFAGIILKQAQLLEEVDSLFVDSQVPQLFDAYRVRHGLVSSIFTIVTVAVPTLTLLVGGYQLALLRRQPVLRWARSGAVVEPPPLKGGAHIDVLLCHGKGAGANTAAHDIQKRLALLIPGLSIELSAGEEVRSLQRTSRKSDNTENARGKGRLLAATGTFVVLLEPSLFQSSSAVAQLAAAIDAGRPLVVVVPCLALSGAVATDALRQRCPDAWLVHLFPPRIIPWFQGESSPVGPLSLVSLKLLGMSLLGMDTSPQSEPEPQLVVTPRDPTTEPFTAPAPPSSTEVEALLYCSPNNHGARALVSELLDAMGTAAPANEVVATYEPEARRAATSLLVYLRAPPADADAAAAPGAASAFAREVEAAAAEEQPLLIVLECDPDRGGALPASLLSQQPELANALAVHVDAVSGAAALRSGTTPSCDHEMAARLAVHLHAAEHRVVGLHQLAERVGAPTGGAAGGQLGRGSESPFMMLRRRRTVAAPDASTSLMGRSR